MNSLTPSAKKQITLDWRSCFPGLGVYRPMHLLRRCGPLLLGILLERDSGNISYRPTFHVHNLAAEFSTITLTLTHQLRTQRTGAPETIDVKYHQGKYHEAAARLSHQAPLSLRGDLSLSTVLDAYQDFIEWPTTHFEPHLYEDMALLCAWASKEVLARDLVYEAHSTMKRWPSEVLAAIGGLDAWVISLERRLADPDAIHETVAHQIENLRAHKIPIGRLSVDV